MNRPKIVPTPVHWVLLVTLAAGLAIYPLLPPGIPSTADGPLHLIRGVEFDAVLRSGVLYPRWAPDLAYGYGYPLFNYYAPLFYDLTEIPHLLGASFELALKLIIFVAFAVYGLAMFWWTRPLLGDAPAAVAGVAYVYVPFRFHEAYMQGDYPQFLAMALAPLALGALHRVFAAARLSFWRVTALIVALCAVLLVHNISTLWLGATLAGYTVALFVGAWATGGGPHAPRSTRAARLAVLTRLASAAGAAVLALGLTAFFWLPALAEQNLVQLYRLRTDDYDVRHSFIDLATLLAPPSVVDQTAANPPPFLHLGWGQLCLAIATIPLVSWIAWRSTRGVMGSGGAHRFLPGRPGSGRSPGFRRGSLRPGVPVPPSASPLPSSVTARPALDSATVTHLVFGWLLLLASAALTLPISTPVWRAVPLIGYTQFPWRVLELSGIATALLAGIACFLALQVLGAANRQQKSAAGWPATAVVGGALLILMVPSLVYLYPRQPFLVRGQLTPADVTAFERSGGAVGTTSTGEYYPLAVRDRPTAPLPANLSVVGRLDRATLPAGGHATFLGSFGYAERYRLSLPAPARLRFRLIDFAGWQVTIDGRPVATAASPGQGLLEVLVPAGDHRLRIDFVDTPVRRLGWLSAALSLVVLLLAGLAMACARARQRGRLAPPVASIDQGRGPVVLTTGEGLGGEESGGVIPISRRGVLGLCGGVLGLIVLRATSPAPYAAVFARRSPLDHVLGISHPMLVRLEDKVEFLGYDLADALVMPGGQLALTLYWRALAPLTTDFRSLAMVARVGDKGLLAQDDRVNPGGVPTHTWPTDRYFIDQHTIVIPRNAPPMVYQLQVALYDPKTLVHLQQDGVSGWAGQQIVLQQVHVLRPKPVNPASYRSIGDPVFGGVITLLGYRLNADHVRPGQSLELTLIWRAERPLTTDYTVFTHVIDAHQQQVAGNDSVPVNGQYPTATWLAGEDVVDVHTIALPADLPAGRYHLAFGLYESRTLQRLDANEQGWSAPRSQIDLDNVPIQVEPSQ